MRFHLRRALAYVVVSFVIFCFIVSHFDTEDFKDDYHHRPNVKEIKRTSPTRRTEVTTKSVAFAHSPVSKYLSSYIIHNKGAESAVLWPNPSHTHDDRIVRQINYLPVGYRERNSSKRVKTIYVPGGLGETPEGQEKFINDKCPVRRCALSTNSHEADTADAVVIQSDGYGTEDMDKPSHQIWILWVLESPMNTVDYSHLEDKINWTATYRWDSTIVTPYEKYVPFQNSSAKNVKNYAKGKTKLVAWFVSNCLTSNNRMEYVQKLSRYIDVDIYGACGSMECSRTDKNKCDTMLKTEYKFYLSFENSNCDYYITEKLFWNALWNDVVPVVMGARKEDYLAAAPPHSFIHVDDFSSPERLADYLLHLDNDDKSYNRYMSWKTAGHFIDTKFWCRLCTMLHALDEPGGGVVSWYPSIETWWRRPQICKDSIWAGVGRNSVTPKL